jgi:hypothetical protein
MSVPLDGSQAPTQAVTSTTEPNPTYVAVSGTSVYWVNSGTYSSDNYQSNGSIRRAPRGQNQTATTLAQLSLYADPGLIAVDSKSVYTVGLNMFGGGHDLIAASTLGGAASPIVPKLGQVGGLFADAVGVFWGDLNGQLMECSANGCNQMGTKILGSNPIYALTADAKAFAWGTTDGFIYLLAR